MRVPLHDRTVHEGPGIPFVSIADNIFDIRYTFAGEAPFHSCREASASTSPEPGALDFFNDIVRGFLQYACGQGKIPVPGNVFLYILRIYESAVPQGDPLLLPVEIHVLGVADALPCLRVDIEQALNPSASDDMLIDNVMGIIRSHLCIECVVRDNLDHRSLFAEAEASRSDDINLVGEPPVFQKFLDFIADEMARGGFATSASADQNLHVTCAGIKTAAVAVRGLVALFPQEKFLRGSSPDGFQILNCQYFH